MPRLTLSEQVNQQASTISALQDELTNLRQVSAANLSTMESQQKEIFELRQRLRTDGELEKKLADAEERFKSKSSSYDYIVTEKNRLEAEMEQAHAVLDGVDGAPGREYDGEYGKRYRNVVTRLAGAFLAIAKNGGAK